MLRAPLLRALLLPSALVALAACGGDDPAPPPPPAVRVVDVSSAEPGTRSFSGTTRAAVESRVSFLVGGTVVRTAVDVGQRVSRGQLIAVVNPADYELQAQQARSGVAIADQQVVQARAGAAAARSGIAAAEAAVAQAEAGAALAEAEYARVRALYAEALVPLSLYDATRTGAETARAGVRAAEAAAAQARAGADAASAGVGTASAAADASRDGASLARRQLNYTRLYSPVSGAVAGVFVETGELVQPGQPVALVTTQGGPMEVETEVPESVVGQIQAGDAVVVRLSGVSEEAFAATVTEVGVAPGRTSTSYPVVVRLSRADPRVRSGMTARVEIDTPGDAGGGLVVPAGAVYQDGAGPYALVVSDRPAPRASGDAEPGDAEARTPAADATVTRRAVTTGALRAGGVEVTSGLRAGDRVVASGGGELASGTAVRVLDRDPLAEERSGF